MLLIGFFFANISALIYEVAWSRVLGYVFGTSMLAISAVISSFMGGLALGSYLGGRLADSSKSPIRLFAYIQICIGLYGITTIVVFVFKVLSYPYLFIYQYLNDIFDVALFGLSFIILIVPTSLIGAMFPVFNKVYVKAENPGKEFGIVYSADTIGAAIGALSSGFVLIPLLGISKTILWAALINLTTGVIILKADR